MNNNPLIPNNQKTLKATIKNYKKFSHFYSLLLLFIVATTFYSSDQFINIGYLPYLQVAIITFSSCTLVFNISSLFFLHNYEKYPNKLNSFNVLTITSLSGVFILTASSLLASYMYSCGSCFISIQGELSGKDIVDSISCSNNGFSGCNIGNVYNIAAEYVQGLCQQRQSCYTDSLTVYSRGYALVPQLIACIGAGFVNFMYLLTFIYYRRELKEFQIIPLNSNQEDLN
ncbi:transmembrane protein, putative (macronuclear) [Tetrahymena thermophila SB210]|uniref:Transmembrane protein, putative n=1 Tax=Tetrahymena thermophila (strain SB210) TaxID=312017 RepID=W7XJN7_TETTS|nr:transmembrane protein, putative [Tetrahymena thermophila SB210]EWS75716.1 transmembrane protein, putative [Tetrahymena thermophila SB210]|eukprot:XP_012651739.1 transmembrane protein, putative [Tetrahymena thermophila SB210]